MQVAHCHLLLTLDVGLVVSKDDVLAVLRNIVGPVLLLIEVVIHATNPVVVAAGILFRVVSRTSSLSLFTILVGFATSIHSYRHTVFVYFALDASLFIDHIFGYVVTAFNGIKTSVAVTVGIKEVRNTIHVIIAWQHDGNERIHHTTFVSALCKLKILSVGLDIEV